MRTSPTEQYCATEEDPEGSAGEVEEEFDRGDNTDRINSLTEKLQRMVLRKREPTKCGEDLSREKYDLRMQEQKAGAVRLEKQLKSRRFLERLVDEQLDRYHARYKTSMTATRLKDVAQLLMPDWTPPLELAAVGWFGDWRPSSILVLLRALNRGASSDAGDRLLSKLIHEIRIEEKVLDEEMAEIQAMCILRLPFANLGNRPGLGLRSELGKIDRVISKAQNLRFKALEMGVGKILSTTDAGEFLVAFEGIQDCIHQLAAQHKICPTNVLAMPPLL